MRNFVVDDINKVIKNYGLNQYGDPIFRVVFSDDQVEKRKGTFNEYYGQIFVRTTIDIKEVQKYQWIKRKWILERWAPGSISYHPDLVTDKDGVYICVYIFQDKDGNYLPPLLKVCEIVIKQLLNPRGKSEALAQDKILEEKIEEIEVNKIEEEFKIASDEAALKDKKSSRETMSVGYVKSEIGE